MSLVEERLTEQFFRWEIRGRGWQLWDRPVRPEPAFVPFTGHGLPFDPIQDDGRKPTAFSSFARRIGLLAEKPAADAPEPEQEPVPRLAERGELVELQISIPKDRNFGQGDYAYFFAALSVCEGPVSFEIIGEAARTSVQFAVDPADASIVRAQLETFFPDISVVTRPDFLRDALERIAGDVEVVECGLSREFAMPLSLGRGTEPLTPLLAILGQTEKGEVAVFQVAFEPVGHPWGESIIASVTDEAGRPFFVNAPELLQGAKQKVSGPLYAAVVRVAAKAQRAGRAAEKVAHMAGALSVFDNPGGNSLIILENEEYDPAEHVEDFTSRLSRRSGMILNGDELFGFVHLPSGDVNAPKLFDPTKTKRAPDTIIGGDGVLLGTNLHLGTESPVFLTADQRMRHMHVIGASGTGKSTLLLNLIRQDIERGGGLAVLDPHGDLIDHVLGSIPESRIDDVILLDPADPEYSVGLNILAAHSELEKTLLASDLVSVFERLSTSWGDQLGSVLRNSILAFLESEKGGSLSDLRRFLLEPSFRESFLQTVRDPEVVYYWRHAFPVLSGGKSIGPVITRLETFLAPKSIRYMVSQRENRVDFGRIMDEGKILLAKLSQGTIGRENSYLLGALLVSKIQQLAMSRQAQSQASRRDCFLYIDEFHNFITPSMAEILSGARKYHLGLVLSHQELRQLERDRDVSSAVLSNCYTRATFRVGDQDARALAGSLSYFDAKDLQSLGTGEAICRVERSDFDFNLRVPPPEIVDAGTSESIRRRVIEASRAKYAKSRAEVESELSGGLPLAPRPESRQRTTVVPLVELPARLPEPKPEPLPEAPPKVKAPVAPSPGRGGSVHKYLQQFVKQWAEGMGWRTTIEQKLPEGGSVDVALTRGGISIACEIAMTTSVEHEVGNMRKCLAADFTWVVSLVPEEGRLETIRREVTKVLSKEEAKRVRFLVPPDLPKFVEGIQPTAKTSESVVKGYKVKVNYRPLSIEEATERRKLVTKIVAETVKKEP